MWSKAGYALIEPPSLGILHGALLNTGDGGMTIAGSNPLKWAGSSWYSVISNSIVTKEPSKPCNQGFDWLGIVTTCVTECGLRYKVAVHCTWRPNVGKEVPGQLDTIVGRRTESRAEGLVLDVSWDKRVRVWVNLLHCHSRTASSDTGNKAAVRCM